MTGSIVFNRQHSSTAGSNLRSELVRPKLRRYSSVGCHGSFESTTDETFEKKCLDKCDPTSSDNDSGIEDFDQQLISVTVETMNDKQKEDIDECEPIFTAGKNEVLEAHSPQTTIQSNEVAENFDENILLRDLERAAKIKHEEKKEFCRDTSIVFHGEFARLISMPISLMCPGINYHLIPEEGLYLDPQYLSNCAWIEIGNAKAQFKCLNPNCYRLWTSMRARIVFKISYPSECAFVFFKIFGQLCEVCESPAESLWYMEEVCRVMENFKNSMFNILFGVPNPTEHNQSIETPIRNHWKPRHDSSQRKGNMRTPHRASHCEACLSGCCYPRNN